MATLYRYYDYIGMLLYVGQTGQGHRRAHGHAAGSHWWHFVHFAEFHEVHSGNLDLAERLAIWVEKPLFNVQARTTTAMRQAMLARLAEAEADHYGSEIGIKEASRILALSEHDINRAVRWGFLKCDYPRMRWWTADQLREFIGESDPGPLNPRMLVGYGQTEVTRRLLPNHLGSALEREAVA